MRLKVFLCFCCTLSQAIAARFARVPPIDLQPQIDPQAPPIYGQRTDNPSGLDAVIMPAPQPDNSLVDNSQANSSQPDNSSQAELNSGEIPADYEQTYIIANAENASCPGTKSCLNCCPLGRQRDSNGCFVCTCKTSGLFEGDIKIGGKGYKRLLMRYGADDGTKQRGAVDLKDAEWPRQDGEKEVYIPYVFDSTLTPYKRQRIAEAIERYQTRTCLRFRRRTTEQDYLDFHGTGGCSSYVGRYGGGQRITIGDNCATNLGTILHEIMHAIGFWHEQSRGDRDNYVTIKWENIRPIATANFDKQVKFWNSYGSPYDLGSVMHYGGYFFSKGRNLPTIVNRKTGKAVAYQRDDFSGEDVRQINLKYKCSDYLTGEITTTSTIHTTTSEATTPATKCRDRLHTDTCQEYKRMGYCDRSYLMTNCYKTCSGCESPTTVKPTSIPTTTTTRGTHVCADQKDNCKQWAANNYCTNPRVKTFMEKNCKASCKICEEKVIEKICMDKVGYCKTWANLGFCNKDSYRTYMVQNCNASCKLCGGGDTTTTIRTTTTVSTTTRPTTTRTTTTSTTEPTTTATTTTEPITRTTAPSNCKDKNKYCVTWGNSGYCTNPRYKNYMATNCKLSCNKCPQPTTVAPTNSPARTITLYNGACGIPEENLDFTGTQQRIVGGVTSTYGTLPWQAALMRRSNNLNVCGGSLVNNQYVVTAAHCFNGIMRPNERLFYVYLGKHRKLASKTDVGQMKVEISSIKVHYNYDHDTSNNDIAILKLARPVSFTTYIRPVCLPTTADNNLPSNTVALVSGWGDTLDGTSRNQVLQQVDVRTISNAVCNVWLNSLYGEGDEVTDNMLCAGYKEGKKDACQGDSGGPLVIKKGRQHVLIGIVSWGYDCAERQKPGVYTRVSRYVPWLTRHMT